MKASEILRATELMSQSSLPPTKMLYEPEESAGVQGGCWSRPTIMEGMAETAETAAKLARIEAASIFEFV